MPLLLADAAAVPLDVPGWFWYAFTGGVVLLLALDMVVFHRRPHEVRTREAVGWTIFWVVWADARRARVTGTAPAAPRAAAPLRR